MADMKAVSRFLLLAVPLGWLALSIYSYSQVDLNLTLSSNPIYLSFLQVMQRLGYYERPFSTVIFSILVLFLTLTYILLVSFLKKKTFHFPLVRLILLVYAIVVFAYPAFSYDIFNYIFDARIVTVHHLSPYYFRALDFPDDSWTRFMRWTHRYYPYGPLWLILSVVPLSLGQGKFLVTLLLFKSFFFLGAIVNVYLIRLIARQVIPQHELPAIAFFALNPLVIVESLISPHNDVFLLLFALLGLHFIIKKRFLFSFLALGASVSIKFLTFIFLPFFLWKWWKKDSLSDSVLIGLMLISFIIALVPVIYLREAYPWYFLPVVGLSTFFIRRPFVTGIIYGLTLGEVLRYAPVLWFGHYNFPVPFISSWLTIGCVVFAMIIAGFPRLFDGKTTIKN